MASGGGGIIVEINGARNDANGIADHLKRLCRSNGSSGGGSNNSSISSSGSSDASQQNHHGRSKSTNSRPVVDSAAQTDGQALKDELQDKLEQRDHMWRQHERAQIAFLQQDHAKMLQGLHIEIERLQLLCRDLQARLYIRYPHGSKPETQDGCDKERAMKQLEEAKHTIEQLQSKVKAKDSKIASLEHKSSEQTSGLKEQMGQQAEKIRQLTRELHDRTTTVTHLSTQLRNVRLKEAMLQAQQRRRASFESPRRTKSGGISIRVENPTQSQPVSARSATMSSTPGTGSSMVRHATVSVSYSTPAARTGHALPPIDTNVSAIAIGAGGQAGSAGIDKPGTSVFRRKPSIRSPRKLQQVSPQHQAKSSHSTPRDTKS